MAERRRSSTIHGLDSLLFPALSSDSLTDRGCFADDRQIRNQT
jgi:hypothetical protein